MSTKINNLLLLITTQQRHYLSPGIMKWDESMLFLTTEPNGVSLLNSWLSNVGSDLKTKAEIIDALKAADWKNHGVDFAEREMWGKP